MNYKDLITELLVEFKSQGYDRRTLERELGYSENYLDQILSKGGNEKAYRTLIAYRDRMLLKEDTAPYGKSNLINSQQETIERMTKMLEQEMKRSQDLFEKLSDSQQKLMDLMHQKQHRRSA